MSDQAATTTQSKRFNAVYLSAGTVRRIIFEAADLADARQWAERWGIGVEGEADPAGYVRPALPEAYDVKTTCQMLGGVCRRTVWKLITLGKLDRVPDVRRVLVTRRSLERYGGKS